MSNIDDIIMMSTDEAEISFVAEFSTVGMIDGADIVFMIKNGLFTTDDEDIEEIEYIELSEEELNIMFD